MKSSKSPLAGSLARWPIRVRLQTVMVLGTALIVLLGLVVNEFRADKLRRQAFAEIQRMGGHATMDRSHEAPKHPGVINGWICFFFGEDYFGKVRDVSYSPKSRKELSLLSHMPELRHLSLAESATSVADLMNISELENLETLSLSGVQISDGELRMLASLPSLANVHFSNCRLPENLQPLSNLANLSRFGISRCKLPQDSWQLLGDKRLIDLSVEGCSLSKRDFEAIQQNLQLRSFSLVDSPVSERDLIEIRRANPNCRISYKINSKTETAFILPDQHGLTNSDLWLRYDGHSLSKLTLEFIRQAPKLRSLSLVDCQLTDEDLEPLKGLRELESLSLGKDEITEARIGELIRDLPSLQHLSLNSLQLSSFDFLAQAKCLKSLSLVGCTYNQANFDDAQALPETLGFSGTCPSSESLQKIFEHQDKLNSLSMSQLTLPLGCLEKIPTNLGFLGLYNIELTDAHIAHLAQRLSSGTTAVEIVDCRLLTDACIDDLAKIAKCHLTLRFTEAGFSDKGNSRLKQLPKADIFRSKKKTPE